MQTSIKLGEEIKRIRAGLKCEQKEFARLIGVSNVHLSNLENGKKLPSEDLLIKIFRVVNLEVPENILEMLKGARQETKKVSSESTSSEIVYNLQEEGIYNYTRLKDLLKLEPDNLKLIFGMLTLLKEEGRSEEARQHLLQSLIHIKKDEVKRWLEACYFLLEGNFKTAIELMRKAIDEFVNVTSVNEENYNKKKAGLLFELANMYYEYGYYSYNHEHNDSLATENFKISLQQFNLLREFHIEPNYEMQYANVFWWLAFLRDNPEENWEAYIDKAENVLLLNHEYTMRKSQPGKIARTLYSEPYILQIISGLAEAYAQLAKIEIEKINDNEKTKKINSLLKQGEFLLAQHSPINILPEKKEYYNFYFSYACFYSLKAEIKHKLNQDFENYLDLCGRGLQEAVYCNIKNRLIRIHSCVINIGYVQINIIYSY